MTQCGFVSLDGSPGFFYHPKFGAEVVGETHKLKTKTGILKREPAFQNEHRS